MSNPTNLVISAVSIAPYKDTKSAIDYISDHKLYATAIHLLRHNHKVLVAIIGDNISDLSKSLTMYPNSATVLNADKNTPLKACDKPDHEYVDPLVVIESSSYKKAQYWINEGRNNGYVCIVIEVTPDELAKIVVDINALSVSPTTKPVVIPAVPPPMYYGVFITHEEITSVLGAVEYKQNTPLHVTCLFVGNNRKMPVNPAAVNAVNSHVLVRVLGRSTSAAGSCLVVQETIKGTFAAIEEKVVPHITLTTNDKFKPVDVGKQITFDNTEPLVGIGGNGLAYDTSSEKKFVVLNGIYSAIW